MEQAPQSRLKDLITKGKEQGYLTFAQVNDHLPQDIIDSDQVEDIVSMINDMGITVHENAPDADDLTLNDDNVQADEEAAEEAAIPESITRNATFSGEIRYCSQTHRGLNNDGIFAYDLWLDETFEPYNTDGEVESFQLMPIEEMARITESTDEFKDNCNLVNIDLLLRLGVINNNHPDYNEIISKLYTKPTTDKSPVGQT